MNLFVCFFNTRRPSVFMRFGPYKKVVDQQVTNNETKVESAVSLS